MNSENFRQYLQSEFAKRLRRNPSYSLRAFAKQLELNSGALSQILSGKRPITDKMIKKLSESLNLPPSEMRNFVPALEGYSTLEEDRADLLKDWVHFAIIEMTYIKDFNSDPEWIAKGLKVPRARVQDCLERLIRLKVLENSRGRLIDVSGGHNFFGDSEVTAKARKRLQKQWFAKAFRAIDAYPHGVRFHSGITMSVSSKKIAGAIEIINKFRRDLREYLGKNGSRDQVYHLSIGLFPLVDPGQLNINLKLKKKRGEEK